MSIKVGLVGTGTVGGGCIDIIQKHAEDFKRHYGIDLELAQVCSREPEQAEAHGVADIFTLDYMDIVNNPEIDVVIELIGGTRVAKDVVEKALQAGKNVVTANKALMATCGEELMDLAKAQGKDILFEASVGGGIPIIGPLKNQLISNEINNVMGIVNGTTNYMLTRISQGLSYDESLREAQAKGFAEADPTADVDGFDAAAKIAILASIAFNSRVVMDDVFTEGIRGITPLDLEAADSLGYCVKLLAIARRSSKGVDVRVHPTMLPKEHQLASVNGVDNAIFVVGDAVGETMFYGPGAGAGPAASAVMGDVLELARRLTLGVGPIVGCTCTDDLPISPKENLKTRYYVRFNVADRPGVLAAMTAVFAQHNVSVHSVMQRGTTCQENDTVNVIYITHVAKESDMQAVLADIAALEGVLYGEPALIRVER
ncbi:MAG: homoserine dehydrogenase [Coriobacteriia bacterium]|nr:homoserine dehydrogenase [Coriobacteriia bacterium]